MKTQPTFATLMKNVTESRVHAEASFKDALFWYEQVILDEQAIIASTTTVQDDKDIARHGIAIATRVVQGLKVLKAV